jgi:SAM-dependent methyltransferase
MSVAALFERILPLVPGIEARLADGLDKACGSGRAVIAFPHAVPASRFTGIDVSAEAVASSTSLASLQRLPAVRFVQGDVAELHRLGTFDLITAFDEVHDQPRPARVLRRIHESLRTGGTWLTQDIAGDARLADNREHPLGSFLYTVSCLHGMSVSLAGGGQGPGALWGREQAPEMLGAAGLDSVVVETLPHDPIDDYSIAKGAVVGRS